jgi:heme/copper-type cytochrome/quinol oxidase subunit 2
MNECCQDNSNLEYKLTGNGTAVGQCKVCGRKHYRMRAAAMGQRTEDGQSWVVQTAATKQWAPPKKPSGFMEKLKFLLKS